MRRTLVTTGLALAGLIVPFAGTASAAPGDDGVSLAPLCSVLSADTLAELRNSGLIPPDVITKLPEWAQDDATLAVVAREAGSCSGDPVTGAEANAVLCDQVLTVDYITGVVQNPDLDVSAKVQGQILANVSDQNVGQARDLFGCAALPAAEPADPTGPASSDVDCDGLTAEQAAEILANDPSDPNGLDADNDGTPCEVEDGAAGAADDVVPDTAEGVDTGGW